MRADTIEQAIERAKRAAHIRYAKNSATGYPVSENEWYVVWLYTPDVNKLSVLHSKQIERRGKA